MALQYFCFALLFVGFNCQSIDKLFNVPIEGCLKTPNHLPKPIVNEHKLHQECAPWSNKSCCSLETTIKAHSDLNHLGHQMQHCGENGITESCKRHFTRELCYYSCDPYIQPWVLPPERHFHKERLMQVPMCRNDCHQWWTDCKESLTCVRNWRKHFDLRQDLEMNMTLSICPTGSKCQPIKEIFRDEIDFCETVWDNSWLVVADTEPCVQLNFDYLKPNPNRKVAEKYLAKILNRGRDTSAFTQPVYITIFKMLITFALIGIAYKTLRWLCLRILCCRDN